MSDNASKQPCLMVMAGGTGGHVFPGLAVAEHLRAQGWRVHWLGTAERMEARLVPQHQIPISFLKVSGLRGNGLVRMLKAPFQIIAAIVQACRVMRDVKPDVVLGMGGYASGPGGIAARLCGKPLVLHEQNAVAGMTNRLLSRLANRVMVAFPQALASHPRREVIGNPVRQQLFELPDPRQRISPADQPLKVLVVGGSLGARILNQTLPEAIARAIDQAPLALWHQTGKGNRDTVAGAYAGNALQPTELRVDEFIDDMPAALAWADLVICRAGALTVSELAAIGLGAILVPLPHAVDDHQTANARTLSDHQAGILMPQTQLSAQHLAAELVRLAGDREQLIDMAQAARSQAKPDATRAVAETCAKLARK